MENVTGIGRAPIACTGPTRDPALVEGAKRSSIYHNQFFYLHAFFTLVCLCFQRRYLFSLFAILSSEKKVTLAQRLTAVGFPGLFFTDIFG